MTIAVADIQKRLRTELSIGARLGYTALGVAGLSMAGVVTSLLLTEPSLPLRTQAAFVVIAAGGLAWAGFAAWTLARRRVLFATHHVVASTLASVLSATFLVGAILLRERAGVLPIAFNAAMLLVAIAWLIRARRRVALLRERRAALESEGSR